MKWQATIYYVENGFIVEYWDGDGKRKQVYENKDETSKQHTLEMLQDITEFFNQYGSRYDKERIDIRFVKGDKYEK